MAQPDYDTEQPGAYWIAEKLYLCRHCQQRTATVCGKPCAACTLQADVWAFVGNLAAQSGNRLLKRQAKALMARRMEVES